MPERILLVDDDPRVRDVLSRFLEREGYVTIPAVSGEEALERVADHPPDLVLLDVQLPGIDGYTVCRVLKENIATALIPVTILSGLQESEARTRLAALRKRQPLPGMPLRSGMSVTGNRSSGVFPGAPHTF